MSLINCFSYSSPTLA